MPRPVETERRYISGLDGLRALAVLCVLAYHLGFGWAGGGMLGVGVFFTLSGYLITDLLLSHRHRFGHLGLRTFWLRRARRLLPALYLVVGAVSIYVALFDTGQLPEVRRQSISAVLYLANWSTIAAHGSYFARFAAPLPLDHLWSLAIEEQFYLVWPWLLGIGLVAIRHRGWLLAVTLGLAGVSAALTLVLYHPGYDPTRVYEGTDTRALGLLIGAALAMVWPSWTPRLRSRSPLSPGRVARRGPRPGHVALDLAGVAGLAAIGVLVWRTTAFSAFLYPWGLLALSVATAAVIAAVVVPHSRLGPVLGCAPLRWLGVRSYGIYLWQWPIIVLAGAGRGTPPLRIAIAEVAGTLVAAALSWRWLEEPVRAGALGRLWRQARARGRRPASRGRAVIVLAAGPAAAVAVGIGLSGLLPVAGSGAASGSAAGDSFGARAVVQTTTAPAPSRFHTAAAVGATRRRRRRTAGRTACRSVVYIGDSTSEGEISPQYIPNPRQRLAAELVRRGVRVVISEISPGRSIVETLDGNPNAATVARQQIAAGFRGCWILAMGTNDAADVAVGSNVGLPARIAEMMRIIGDQPTLWVEAVTLTGSGAYAEAGMARWDGDLLRACARHPQLRVFDWPRRARRAWFLRDRIHYYSPGYTARTHLIAKALAEAFPARAPRSHSCVVP